MTLPEEEVSPSGHGVILKASDRTRRVNETAFRFSWNYFFYSFLTYVWRLKNLTVYVPSSVFKARGLGVLCRMCLFTKEKQPRHNESKTWMFREHLFPDKWKWNSLSVYSNIRWSGIQANCLLKQEDMTGWALDNNYAHLANWGRRAAKGCAYNGLTSTQPVVYCFPNKKIWEKKMHQNC